MPVEQIGMASDRVRFSGLCEEICREEGWERLPNGIRVSWPNGRHQLIALEYFEQDGKEFVRFSTRIGPVDQLDEDRLVMALRVNSGLAHGALGVLHDSLVMVDTQLLRDADPAEISESIDYLARNADAYEKSLFGTDIY